MTLEHFEASNPKHSEETEGFISEEALYKFGIAEKGENILRIFQRVVDAVAEVETIYSDQERVDRFKAQIFQLLKDKKFIPSTPILMNAGRMKNEPLSACIVPSVDLGGDLSRVKRVVDNLHNSGMGTGFNFDDIEDPTPIIEYLNNIAIEGQASDKQLRPVGNMGSLAITHPRITDFIQIKNAHKNRPWIFNFSVNVDEDSAHKIKNGEPIISKDGRTVSSTEIIDQMARSIYTSGEPGLSFVDRLNRDNQVPSAGAYKSLAPCGEVGLAEGETCQFSYINLGQFVNDGSIDYDGLKQAIELVVRFLDDTVEYNISRYESDASRDIAKKKRKIGLGVCGFADLLAKLKIDYASPEAIELARNIFSFINYISKKTSSELALERGAFGDFEKSRYVGDDSIIRRYSRQETETVSRDSWLALDAEIREHGIRNCATVSLPPTGRSCLIIKASQSIEPFFRDMLRISPKDQLLIISAIQEFVDESISKTVNVSEDTTVDEIKNILLMAIDLNLKGITIYRDKSRNGQPIKIQ
ncbi:MAG: ribonucleotide reductase N-terminal alpha domain-containing protein [Patescibacteria group bacterium]|nr:ribonucleotide reductase N-terminal alpha domain-containing protein [Patescibacteria group bacterium]